MTDCPVDPAGDLARQAGSVVCQDTYGHQGGPGGDTRDTGGIVRALCNRPCHVSTVTEFGSHIQASKALGTGNGIVWRYNRSAEGVETREVDG